MRLNSPNGFTLIELVMVIIIIGVLAGVAMKSMDSAIQTGRIESTKKEMEQLATAIAGNPDLISNGTRTDFGYIGDIGSLPPNLDALVTQPSGYTTWKGPYIRNSFNQASEDFKRDAWNALYSYNGGVTIVSTGSGSNITKQIAGAASDLTNNTIQGIVVDALSNPPGTQNNNVNISITYPNGTGATTTATVHPSGNGNYTFSGLPVGLRTITAVNTPTNDTIISYVSILPKSTIIDNIKFGSALWQVSGGSSGDGLQYVTGSASLTGNDNVNFNIYNNTGSDVEITWLKATYTHTPAAYFERVRWGNATIANSTNPRFASGTQVNFSGSRTINNNSTVTIRLQNFNISQSGSGAAANMAGTSFDILFSDSSLISFSL
jgi:prepilin-type N-terminal cleavage/methylation domain-containing protein